jgi:hypothetical protein
MEAQKSPLLSHFAVVHWGGFKFDKLQSKQLEQISTKKSARRLRLEPFTKLLRNF